jgi:hypothetical protein
MVMSENGDEQPLDSEKDLAERARSALPMQMLDTIDEHGNREVIPVVMHSSWDTLPQELKDQDIAEERKRQETVDRLQSESWSALAACAFAHNDIDPSIQVEFVFTVEEQKHLQDQACEASIVVHISSTLEKAYQWADDHRDDLSDDNHCWLIIGQQVDGDEIMHCWYMRKNGRMTINAPHRGHDADFLNQPKPLD